MVSIKNLIFCLIYNGASTIYVMRMFWVIFLKTSSVKHATTFAKLALTNVFDTEEECDAYWKSI